VLEAALGLEFSIVRSEIRCAIRICPYSLTKSPCVNCNSDLDGRSSHHPSIAMTFRSRSCAGAAGFKYRLYWRANTGTSFKEARMRRKTLFTSSRTFLPDRVAVSSHAEIEPQPTPSPSAKDPRRRRLLPSSRRVKRAWCARTDFAARTDEDMGA